MRRSRHGLNSLKAKVKLRGLSAIDMRTAAAQSMIAFQDGLVADLGGEENITTGQRKLAELAARAMLFLDHIDAWILEQPSLLIVRRKELLPVLKERMSLANHLQSVLSQLGLERRAAPIKSAIQIIHESETA